MIRALFLLVMSCISIAALAQTPESAKSNLSAALKSDVASALKTRSYADIASVIVLADRTTTADELKEWCKAAGGGDAVVAEQLRTLTSALAAEGIRRGRLAYESTATADERNLLLASAALNDVRSAFINSRFRILASVMIHSSTDVTDVYRAQIRAEFAARRISRNDVHEFVDVLVMEYLQRRGTPNTSELRTQLRDQYRTSFLD